MFDRDLEQQYKVHATIYEQIVVDAESAFREKTGQPPTIFHRILIDKVADSYVLGIMLADDPQSDSRKYKTIAAELQKWLGMSMAELKAVQAEQQARQNFYRRIVDVIEDAIPDASLRRDVLRQIRKVVEE